LTGFEKEGHQPLRLTSQPLLVLDENGDIHDASRGACEMFGYSREELVSMSLFDIYGRPTIRKERQETLRPILEAGEGSFEAEMKDKEGSILQVRVEAEVLEADGERAMLARLREISGEKQERDELTARLAFLQGAFEGPESPCLLVDGGGRVVAAGSAAARLLKRDAADLKGEAFENLLEKGVVGRELLDLFRSCTAGNPVDSVEFILEEDGEERVIRALAEPVEEGEGERGCLMILEDVTLQRRRLREAEESRDLYHSLVENSPEGIYLVDREGDFIFANRRMCEMLGREAGGLVGDSLLGFIEEDQMDQLKGYFRSKVAGLYAPPLRIDLHAGERSIPVEMDCSLLESGEEITGILGVVRDLTWRLDLEEENRLYRASLESLCALARAVSSSSDFHQCLEGSLQALIDGLGGQAGALLLMEERSDQLELATARGLEPTAVEFLQEKGAVLREGSVGMVLRRREALRAGSGEAEGDIQEELLAVGRECVVGFPVGAEERLSGIVLIYGEEDSLLPASRETLAAMGDVLQVGIARARLLGNISDVLEKEAMINLELRAAERIKEQFVELVDEKLRQPVQRLRAFIDNLQKGWSRFSPAAIDDYFRELSWEMADLERMIDRLLLLSAEESNRLRLEIAPFEITSLLEKVAQIFVSRSGEHEIELELPPYMLIVEADQSLLEHVLVNLMDNAIRFSPEGGPVRLALEEKEKEVVISVRDQGLGFTEEEREHLFEKFAKPLRREKEEMAGLGLGLYLSRVVVEAHGGRVELVSRAGEGSTIFVILPKRRR